VAHAPRGTEVTVTVARRRGKRVAVTVRDHGPGIPREEQPHVFNAFFRGSTSRRRGMGLGLMIAREIVLGHGGRIWLRSQPGDGATFHFSVPIADTPPTTAVG
jgi:signal transduction histidine kinase